MSEEMNSDSFKIGILEEIKKIQEELNELKNLEQNYVEEVTSNSTAAKKTAAKKTAAKKSR